MGAYVSAFDVELDVFQGLMYVHAFFICCELVHHLVAAVYQPLYSLIAVPRAASAYEAIVKVIHLQGAFIIIQNGLRFFCSGVLKGASCFLNPGSLQHRVARPLRNSGMGSPPRSRRRCAIFGAVRPTKLLRLR